MFDNAMLSGFEIYPRLVPLSYRREPHTHSTEGFDDSLETCEIERCSVSEPVFKHNHSPQKCGLGSSFNIITS